MENEKRMIDKKLFIGYLQLKETIRHKFYNNYANKNRYKSLDYKTIVKRVDGVNKLKTPTTEELELIKNWNVLKTAKIFNHYELFNIDNKTDKLVLTEDTPYEELSTIYKERKYTHMLMITTYVIESLNIIKASYSFLTKFNHMYLSFNSFFCRGCKINRIENVLKNYGFDSPDRCIGMLEGVIFACCGHGIKHPFFNLKTNDDFKNYFGDIKDKSKMLTQFDYIIENDTDDYNYNDSYFHPYVVFEDEYIIKNNLYDKIFTWCKDSNSIRYYENGIYRKEDGNYIKCVNLTFNTSEDFHKFIKEVYNK